MAFDIPDATAFKAYFTRDFPYGSTADTVQDSDIDKAIGQASFSLNESLVGTQAEFDIVFLLLTAHYLVVDLRMSSQGIQGQYEWLVSSKSVGSVSVGLSIPDRIMKQPAFAMLSKTPYGAKYLELLLPRLAGQILAISGRTQP